MSLFSFKASFCSRSSGKGAVAQAAYRNGEKYKDKLRGRTFDYSQKHDEHRIHNEILAPEHALEWMKTSSSLWNGVQEFETNLILERYSAHHKDPIKREKSLLGREKALNSAQDAASFIVALPKELTEDQNIDLLRSYLRERFVSRGLVVDYSIHGASGNWHAHFAVTLRPVLESGELSQKKITSYRGDQKTLDIFNKEGLVESRKVFADHINSAYEKYGIDERVSHKSLKDQGIMREATVHEGPYARILDAQGDDSRLCEVNAGIKDQNIDLYMENPHYFLNDLALSCVQFTPEKIAIEIHKLVDGDESLFRDLHTRVSAVAIPDEAKVVHKGGFKIVSEELLKYFTSKNLLPSLDKKIDFNGDVSFKDQSSGEEFKRVGLANILIKEQQKKYGFVDINDAADSALQDIAANPSSLVTKLAAEKIVFRKQDVESTVMTLIGNRETSFRIVEAHHNESDIQSLLRAPANQTIDMQDEFTQKEVAFYANGLVDKIINDESCLGLSSDAKREQVFTSKAQHKYEQETLGRVSRLGKQPDGFALKDTYITKVIGYCESQEDRKLKSRFPDKTFAYTDEQKQGIRTLLSPGQLKILKGRAGTGKSTVLKPVVRALLNDGYDVRGMAFTGKVSESLAEDLDIPSKNIAQYKYAWKEYEDAKETLKRPELLNQKALMAQRKIIQKFESDMIHSKSVIIIDEGSMVSHKDYDVILKRIEDAGAKLLIVKDDAQIKAIHGADISSAMDAYVDSSDLRQVIRQRLPWMQRASEAFNDHRVEEGLFAYEEHGCITYSTNHDAAKTDLVDAYLKNYDHQKSHVALAFSNQDVKDMNVGILKGLQDKDLVSKETFSLKEGHPLAVGAKVMFTANDNTGWRVKTLGSKANAKERGVRNGTFGVIDYHNAETGETRVRLEEDNRLVVFNRPEDAGKFYDGLTLAYALTSSKTQGKTFDCSYGLVSSYDSANTSLVSATRHRDHLEIFVSKDYASDFRSLAKFIGTESYIGTAQDYSISDDEKPFVEKVAVYRDLNIECGKVSSQRFAFQESFHEEHGDRKHWSQDVWAEYNHFKSKFDQDLSALQSSRKEAASDVLANWRHCSVFAKQASLSEERLSHHAGMMQGRFTSLELKRLETIESYFNTCQEIHNLRDRMIKDLPQSLMEQHELYGLYEELVDHRTHVATSIARSPQAHQHLMRVRPVFDGIEPTNDTDPKTPVAYEMVTGKSFDRKPPSFEMCLEHAKYKDPDPLVFDISETGKLQSELFTALVAYQKADQRFRQSYYDLQRSDAFFAMPGVKEKLEAQRASDELIRDQSAGKVHTIMKSLEAPEPILDYVGFDQKDCERLVAASLSYHFREAIRAFESAESLSERFERGKVIQALIYKGDEVDKKAYGQCKGLGLDPQRLQFEQAVCQFAPELYKDVQALQAAYTDIDAYKTARSAEKESWQIIKSTIHGRIQSIQLDQINSLNQARREPLRYDVLRDQAFEALKFNVGNDDEPDWRVSEDKVLAYVSGELRRATTDSKGHAHLRSEILSQDRQLRAMNQVLHGGRKAAFKHFHDMDEHSTYLADVRNKEDLAADVLKNHGSVIRIAFDDWFGESLSRDAKQSESRKLVDAFVASDGFTKADLARQILRQLDEDEVSETSQDNSSKSEGSQKAKPGSYALRNALRPHDIYPKGVELQLYALAHDHSVTAHERDLVMKTIDGYVNAYKAHIAIKQKAKQNAETKLGTIHKSYEQSLATLSDQFEDMSPHKQLRFDGENLVNQVLKTADAAKIPWRDQIEAFRPENWRLSVYKPIKDSIEDAVATINAEKDWGLSPEQVQAFTKSVMTVALEKRFVDSQLVIESDPQESAALEAKLKHGYELMATSFGDLIRSREDKWAQKLVESYDHHVFATNLKDAFLSADGLEKCSIAAKVVDAMDDSEGGQQRSYVRNYFNEKSLYRNSIELSLYSTLHHAFEGIDERNQEIAFRTADEFAEAYVKRREFYLHLRHKAEQKLAGESTTYQDSVIDVKDAYQRYVASGTVYDYDLRSIERRGTSLMMAAESNKNIRDIGSAVLGEIQDLNDRKQLGLTNEAVSRIHDLSMISVKNKFAYESRVNNLIFLQDKNERYINPEVYEYFALCTTATKKTKALLKLPIANKLMDQKGKWSIDLREHAKKQEEQDRLKPPQKIVNANQFNDPDHGLEQPDKPVVIKKSITRQGMTDHEYSDFLKSINHSIDAERLAHNLLHTRGFNVASSNSERLHFGRKGSMCVFIDGHRRNSYSNFEEEDHGDLIKLVQKEQRCRQRQALEILAPYCSGPIRSELEKFLDGRNVSREIIHDKYHESQRDHKGYEREKQQKISDVKTVVQNSKPVLGTPAETYLRQERSIQGSIPDSLRYLPKDVPFSYKGKKMFRQNDALLSVAKTSTGEIQAIQLTELTAEGKRARNTEGEKLIKRSYGSTAGAYVTLQDGNKNEPFIMAEGVETALSFKEAGVKGQVVCSLGIYNYKSALPKDTNQEVIIAADWDGSKDARTYLEAQKIKDLVEENGGKAQVILPVDEAKADNQKVDFNDVLQKKGVASVRELLNNQAQDILKDKPLNHEQTLSRNESKTASDQHEHSTENAPKMGKVKPVVQSAITPKKAHEMTPEERSELILGKKTDGKSKTLSSQELSDWILNNKRPDRIKPKEKSKDKSLGIER